MKSDWVIYGWDNRRRLYRAVKPNESSSHPFLLAKPAKKQYLFMTTLILVLALFQSAQDLYNSAATDFEAGRWAEAATKYESVLKEDTSHIPSRFNLAVCYTKLGNSDAAIAAYRTLLDQNGAIYE